MAISSYLGGSNSGYNTGINPSAGMGAPDSRRVGIRKYLNDNGYNDNQIGYGGGNVTLNGKNFYGATPQAYDDSASGMMAGSTYGSPTALGNALKTYQGNDRNSMLNNTLGNVNSGVNTTNPFQFKQQQSPFNYNANSDPAYQSQLALAKNNIQTGQNNTMANLAAHGQGNSSYAATATQQVADREYNNLSNQILPNLIQQAYQRYQDQNNNDYRNQSANYGVGQDQLHNQSALASQLNGLNQQDFNNNLATNQDTRSQQAQDATFTGNYNDPQAAAIQKLMASNSAAYGTASPEEQARLHDQNIALAKSIGGTDTTGNGDYSFGQGQRTMAGKQADITNAEGQFKLDQLKDPNSFANQQLKAQLGLTNAQAGYYKDHGNYYDARAYGGGGSSTANQQVSQLMKVWQNTGKAPAGIPGVQEGTPLASKTTSTQNNNQGISNLTSDVDQMSPENRSMFFKEQKANIIAEHGVAGYNQLHNMYFDKYGDPK